MKKYSRHEVKQSAQEEIGSSIVDTGYNTYKTDTLKIISIEFFESIVRNIYSHVHQN